MSAAIHWVFTHNDFVSYTHVTELPEECRTLVFQLEKAPETGHLHLQGYLALKRKARATHVKLVLQELFGGQPHVEKAHNPRAAYEYAKKEESRVDGPIVLGEEFHAQGHRTDLSEVADAIMKRSKTMEEVAMDHPTSLIKYPRGLSLLRSIKISSVGKKRDSFELVYLWGAPGCGKSTAVRNRWPDAYHLTETKEGWLGTYDGQNTIVIDEFAGIYPLPLLLRLCQPLPFEAPIKGGHVWVTATTVVFTSNHPPETLYQNERNYTAWLSRLTPQRNGRVIPADGLDWAQLKTVLEEPGYLVPPTQQVQSPVLSPFVPSP